MKEGANTVAEMRAKAEEAAHDLQGTCRTLRELGYEDHEDSAAFCERLDELVFCCDTCSWWHEQSEMAHDDPDNAWICQECYDEGKDE